MIERWDSSKIETNICTIWEVISNGHYTNERFRLLALIITNDIWLWMSAIGSESNTDIYTWYQHCVSYIFKYKQGYWLWVRITLRD